MKLKTLVEYVVRGGGLETIEAVLDKDISQIDGINRDKRKMEMLLRALARNESTNCTNSLLAKDICEDSIDAEMEASRNTIAKYIKRKIIK